jgi:hypothetical protein
VDEELQLTRGTQSEIDAGLWIFWLKGERLEFESSSGVVIDHVPINPRLPVQESD